MTAFAKAAARQERARSRTHDPHDPHQPYDPCDPKDPGVTITADEGG